MSDQRNAAEIEDVLSSIRRLVAEELRADAAPARRKKAKPDPQPGKLILTPALRVDQAETVPETLAPLITTEQDRVRDDVVVDMSTHKRRKPGPVASDRMAVTPADPVTADPIAVDPAGAEAVAAVLLGDKPLVAPTVDIEDAVIVVDQVVQQVLPSSGVSTPVEVIVADEAAFVDADVAAAPTTLKSTSDGIEGTAIKDPTLLVSVEEEPFDVAEGLSAKNPPDDRIFIPKFRTNRTVVGNDGGAEPEFETMDEDTLRDLVRDVIREEFQGMLGERITRNVRKLVRTEINRALVSKGLT
jgi:hypothetical protein